MERLISPLNAPTTTATGAARELAVRDRRLAAAHHDRVGAGEGVRHALDAGRLIVPLDDIADRLALNAPATTTGSAADALLTTGAQGSGRNCDRSSQ
jgi:hypothetical protein